MRDTFVTVATPARFSLELRGVSATEELTARAPHRVVAHGTLRFVATGDLPVALSRATVTGHGMVELAPNVTISRVRASGPDAVASVDLGDVRLHSLRLPCESLVLGTRGSSAYAMDRDRGDWTFWISASRRLRLQAGPGRGPIIEAWLPVREFVMLTRMARSGEWSRVRWSTGTGSSLEGWVPQQDLAPVPPGDRAGYRVGRGTMGCRGGTPGGPRVYVGPARVRYDAPVRDRPGGVAWATTDTAEPVEVAHWEGEPWVQLRRVPDFAETCNTLSHAWLALDDVELPANAHERPASAAAGDGTAAGGGATAPRAAVE